ncbi:hypothetical protein SCP_1300510 [Sparassis crispa]|uniref:Steroid 5-alpha reductase C-terminal domain-containing protein n=1 Tax=Sparassis crispa TaxID=139825 RepID=A0A401H1C4_9APHY|nr:hypothetical protein SCP_1300510 [Sparassis crispa]GBE88236.1 hypothetical protein SCP_1300510 [Sparassis crispa]
MAILRIQWVAMEFERKVSAPALPVRRVQNFSGGLLTKSFSPAPPSWLGIVGWPRHPVSGIDFLAVGFLCGWSCGGGCSIVDCGAWRTGASGRSCGCDPGDVIASSQCDHVGVHLRYVRGAFGLFTFLFSLDKCERRQNTFTATMPLFSSLFPAAASAYALQAALALIFVPQANEKFYDLGGALGFLSTTVVSLYYPSVKARFWDGKIFVNIPQLNSLAPRQMLLNVALVVWSVRLGSFLITRAIKAGGDSRFDEVKYQPAKFTAYWMAQATWVFAVGLPVYLVNTLPASAHPPLGPLDYISVAFFAGSWLFEIIADRQKAAWRRAKDKKEHDEKFITSGLWGISRHPNYIGEVGLWTGIWLLSTRSLRTPYFPRSAWLLAGVSPLLTWFLLRNVSGVPLLEKAGDEKYGNDPKWQEYKRSVPIFWPWGSPS